MDSKKYKSSPLRFFVARSDLEELRVICMYMCASLRRAVIVPVYFSRDAVAALL